MEETTRVTLGQFLRQRRKNMGLTQRETAELLNITTNYYGEIEHGKKEPSLDLYRSICSKLSLPYNLGNGGNEFDDVYTMLIANCPKDKKENLLTLLQSLYQLMV